MTDVVFLGCVLVLFVASLALRGNKGSRLWNAVFGAAFLALWLTWTYAFTGADGGLPYLPASWNRRAIEEFGRTKHAAGSARYRALLAENAAGHRPGWTFVTVFATVSVLTAIVITTVRLWRGQRAKPFR